MKRLLKLLDRRRWRGVYAVLTADAWFAFGVWERDGRPFRDAVMAVIDDEAARVEVLRVAEERLPATISTGMFDRLPDWLSGRVDPPEPPPDLEERLDPRRFAAMRDAHGAEGFVAVSVWPGGGRAATALLTAESRSQLLEACALVADAIRDGRLDDAGGRIEWHGPESGDRGGGA
jgi:hypothetical protein